MIKNKYLYEEYVKASRILLPQASKVPTLFADVVESLKNAQTDLITYEFDLIDCFSLNKYPCINQINKSNEVLLVYDRYMDHIMELSV